MDWLLGRFSGGTKRTVLARQMTDQVFPLLSKHLSQDIQRWSDSRLSGYIRAKAGRLIDDNLDRLSRIEPRFVARHRNNLWEETLELVTDRVTSRLAPPAPRIYRPAKAA